MGEVFGTSEVDRNHAFHPRTHEALRTLGGQALRNCRIQYVPRIFHNEGVHAYHSFYDGPVIPIDEMDQLVAIVCAVAGYMPKEGIDLTGDTPVIRDISRSELSILQTADSTGDYRYFYYGQGSIEVFVKQMILQRAMHVETEELKKFLSSRDIDIRRKIGMSILQKSSVIIADEISARAFSEAHRRKQLRPEFHHRPHAILQNCIRNPDRLKAQLNQLPTIAEQALGAAA